MKLSNLHMNGIDNEINLYSKEKEVINNDIAVIGIGIRVADTDNIDEFWQKIKLGENLSKLFPEQRKKDIDNYFRNKNYDLNTIKYKKGAFLEHIDEFDYGYFNISPKEANLMNPLQRIFLETAWNCIEDAGYGGNKLKSSDTGVYLGYIGDVEGYKYMEILSEVIPKEDIKISLAGNLSSIIPSRLSYMLDLKGPSMLINCACSSSLVAVHTACQAIKNNECKQAIAGGIRLAFIPVEDGINIGIESSDGMTKTFDNDSDGTGAGEGAIVFFLKAYNEAIKDRDNVYAVIKGSAINQDGTSMGITAPNAKAQSDVIIKALENAKVNPESISYIEAHGTGTKLGDPIEINGITNAFKKYTNKKQFCGIGSVKTNIGHLYEAAGAAGLLKLILALKHREIPANINYENPNKKISFENTPVYVIDELTKWETNNIPRRAGISSFGFSGTNCHMILEEVENAAINDDININENYNILALSAKSNEDLKNLLLKYYKFLEKNPGVNFNNICYTNNIGRGHYSNRLALIVKSIDDLKNKIEDLLNVSFNDYTSKEDIYYAEFHVVENDNQILSEQDLIRSEKIKLDEEARHTINEFLNNEYDSDRKVFEKISCLYISGADIEWEKIYKDKIYKKISIPTYPFKRSRCWVQYTDDIYDISNNISILENIMDKIDSLNSQSQEFNDDMAEIRRFGCLLLIRSFKNMNLLNEPGKQYKKENIKQQIGLLDKYNRLFEALIDILQRNQYVECYDDYIIVKDKMLNEKLTMNLEELKDKLTIRYPEFSAYLELLHACVPEYFNVLPGKIHATNILFPNSSMDLVENVYKGNKTADYFNNLMAESILLSIEELHKKLQGRRPIRILEIGAGTGGTSEIIFKAVNKYADKINYYYTDISLAFIEYGKKKYGNDYNFIDFKTLNVEKDIKMQGFNLGSFDIVLASNVLHATRNISNTLNNARGLLRRNGMFIINEITSIEDFTTLTFGLLDGWWNYEDDEERIKNAPLLSQEKWDNVLKKNKYKNTKFIYKENCNQTLIFTENAEEKDYTNFMPGNVKISNRVKMKSEMRLTGKSEYSETEKKIAEIWRSVLGYEELDVNDKFYDIGGDSILLANMFEKLKVEFPGVFSLSKLFSYPTIAKMSEYVNKKQNNDIIKNKEIINNQDEIERLLDGIEDGKLNIDEIMNKINNI